MARNAPKNKRAAKVFIVDDHPLICRGLAELISDEPDLEVCGDASDVNESMRRIKQLKPDVAVIDIGLKGQSGLELIKRINSRFPHVKMLVSSMYDESLFAERSLRAGALGYINKEEATERIVDAIRCVLKDEIYLSQGMANRLLHGVVSNRKPKPRSLIDSLSDREFEVFGLIGKGLTTREIAETLRLSIKTIETHREHIKTKLEVETGAELSRQAVQWALENG